MAFTLSMPKFVTPKSVAPTDLLTAVVGTEDNAYSDLVQKPMSAMGVTPLPKVATPASVALKLVTPTTPGTSAAIPSPKDLFNRLTGKTASAPEEVMPHTPAPPASTGTPIATAPTIIGSMASPPTQPFFVGTLGSY